MTQPLTEQQLDDIATRAAHLSEYAQQVDEGDTLAGTDVPALLDEIRRLQAELTQYEALNPQQCPADKHADWLVDSEYAHACPWCQIETLKGAAPVEDTLPAWLYSRFNESLDAPAWDRLTDDDRTYWEHHAAAVRRAVVRGGFKATEAGIGSITIRSESIQLDNGECLRDLAIGDSVELRADTSHEGLWICAAFHGDYQERITLQHAEVVVDCGNDPALACEFSGTRHAHPVDLDGKVRPRPTP